MPHLRRSAVIDYLIHDLTVVVFNDGPSGLMSRLRRSSVIE
jgi:hypothetical protein